MRSKKVMGLAMTVLVITASFSFTGDNNEIHHSEPQKPTAITPEPVKLYDSLGLGQKGVPEEAFDYALKGLENLEAAGEIQNDSIISIIDFTESSDKKRLFVININNGKILFNTWVSHGRNSGLSRAEEFSNERSSYKSSLGFYITENTYEGKHGYSLKLKGEEAGINDNAEDRGIVMHAAAYVNESVIKERGYIGRSEGCPAITPKLHRQIISAIKNGSCLFIYSSDPFYLLHSHLLNGNS